MPCLPAILALLFPRLAIVLLYIFQNWFRNAFDSILWPILGFIFAPLGTLWYASVEYFYQGDWSTFRMVIMVILLMFDFGILGNSARKNKKRNSRLMNH